jgi:hypothetical protein
MKTSHKSKNKCKYKTLEKYSNTLNTNKQNINPACACQIYLINSIILLSHIFYWNNAEFACVIKA